MLEFRPARNIDGFFETEVGLANDGKVNYVLRNGRRTVRTKSAMQGALFPLMAKCGRVVGIRGSYTRYSASSPTESPDQMKHRQVGGG